MTRSPNATHTLVITNDFPPRDGGIQTFIYELVKRFEADSITVLASDYEGAAAFDAEQNFRVVRANTQTLLPTRGTRSLASQLVVETGATQVVFGAAAPLGLLARPLRELGVDRIVGITHGHEAGWAITPITRQLLRTIGDNVDHLTFLGDYTKSKIGGVLSESARAQMRQLAPAVDPDVFHPRNKQNAIQLREQFNLKDKRIIVCVSRLMERKGQDALLKAMPIILEEVPDAHLVIVGGGAFESRLHSLAQKLAITDHVTFTGKVPYADLPTWYAVGDVFAMPCRTRNGGWDVEGLGIVFLEASATGLPVIAGDSGGAPDAVRDGQTGIVVDGTDVQCVAATVTEILADPDRAARMGNAGREWVLSNWTWDRAVTRLQTLLAGQDPDV